MTHPAAELLRAIADGKQMEGQVKDGRWVPCSADDALYGISQGFASAVRIARPMVTRQVSYPEPLRVKPAEDTTYWAPSLSMAKTRKFSWYDGAHDNMLFAAGMAFATEADAAEAHKALFGGQT